MKKIAYFCPASELGYQFKKRRWFESRKKNREIIVRLLPNVECQVEIELHILEPCCPQNTEKDRDWGFVNKSVKKDSSRQNQKMVCSYFSEEEATDFILQMIQVFNHNQKEYERIILFDGGLSKSFAEILPLLSSKANQLTIVTASPFIYQEVLDEMYMDCGLIGICESQYHGQSPRGKANSVIYYNEEVKKLPFRDFPYGSDFFDFTFLGRYEREIQKKRPDMAYFGLGKYLDTTVKLRYNTLVKEGKVNQCTIKGNNKKLQDLERA